jgi:hypothetical protein
MLDEIPHKIPVPERLPSRKRNLVDAVPTCVYENGVGTVKNLPAAVIKAAAKINILKPYGVKSVIHSLDVLPGGTADRKASACRLLDLLELAVVEIQGAIAAIPGIQRP